MKTLADFKRRIAVGAVITLVFNNFYEGAKLGPRRVVKVQTNGFAMLCDHKIIWQHYRGADGWQFDGSDCVTRTLAGRPGKYLVYRLPAPEMVVQ